MYKLYTVTLNIIIIYSTIYTVYIQYNYIQLGCLIYHKKK